MSLDATKLDLAPSFCKLLHDLVTDKARSDAGLDFMGQEVDLEPLSASKEI